MISETRQCNACVFPVEPQRPNGKNINLHKKWGFRRFQKECRKVREKCGEPRFLRIFCTLFAQKVRFSALFAHFSALFLESAETPLFVQINVFAVWPLRLDRKYTMQCHIAMSGGFSCVVSHQKPSVGVTFELLSRNPQDS